MNTPEIAWSLQIGNRHFRIVADRTTDFWQLEEQAGRDALGKENWTT